MVAGRDVTAAALSPSTAGGGRSVNDTSPAVPRRLHVRVCGLVQGVGFRPFVYREAVRRGLAGYVRNSPGGVELEAEGPEPSLAAFIRGIRAGAPPLARITELAVDAIRPTGATAFEILESRIAGDGGAFVSPDVATCEACLHEMRTPGNRRYRYPFTNCTHCGPRFSIIEAVPYDRERTAMRAFRLCPDCRREYEDPRDRRYHAEPNACPSCGPRVRLVDASGDEIAEGDDAIRAARKALAEGRILLIKGLGGFHLACDAASGAAVARLRDRKGRPHKPLAVMCRDLIQLRRCCEVSSEEARELTLPERPILLLRRRAGRGGNPELVAPAVAPDHDDLGVMLPYTPLHHLLLDGDGPDFLVMTSGNRSDEPMAIENAHARGFLGEIADALIEHDRTIRNRCDDSVGYVAGGRLVLTRRSRGYAPLPVELDRPVVPTLALGAMSHDVCALAEGRRVFLSQHIGEVDNLGTLAFLRETIEKLRRWLGLQPELIAHDLHPDLLTTHLARELAEGIPTVAVQHHHAHFAAALAAARHAGEAQGLVLDGTGFGPDGTIFGGELFVGSVARVRRAGHLRLLPLPGGEAAIRRPLRLAVAYLHALVPQAADAPLDLWRRAEPEEVSVVRQMVDRRFNAPMTSSAGRLFDVVAALLGVRDEITYDGQAAIELEQLARRGRPRPRGSRRGRGLHLEIRDENDRLILDPQPLLLGLVDALLAGADRADLALEFHEALARGLVSACRSIRDAGGPETVALSGGVFQNRLLTQLTVDGLEATNLSPIRPGTIPVNDAGLALGQVVVANARRDAGTAAEGEE